jgi:hypothetical protein
MDATEWGVLGFLSTLAGLALVVSFEGAYPLSLLGLLLALVGTLLVLGAVVSATLDR